jgi:hypothetical protein
MFLDEKAPQPVSKTAQYQNSTQQANITGVHRQDLFKMVEFGPTKCGPFMKGEKQ